MVDIERGLDTVEGQSDTIVVYLARNEILPFLFMMLGASISCSMTYRCMMAK
jgi:hypothetical protein